MNKIIKKSMAGLLAGVMAASSLFVGGMTALAEAKTFTPYTAGTAVTFTGKENEYDKDSKLIKDNEHAYYTFKPSASGYYGISFSASYETDKETQRRTYYDAYLNLYTKYDASKEETGSNPFDDSVVSTWGQAEEFTTTVTPKSGEGKTTYTYVDNYKTVKLYASKTYYIAIYSDSYYDYETSKLTYATANLNIAPIDFEAYLESRSETTTDASETTTKTTTPYYEVYYEGLGSEVVVPDTINNVPVEVVEGTANSNITSLTLGKNVKRVEEFSGLTKLASLTLNEGLETIDSSAFSGDSALSGKLTIPASVKTVGSYAFYETGYDSAQVLGAKTKIGSRALGFGEVDNTATVNPKDTKIAVINDFIMVAPAGSTAAAYAEENGISCYAPDTKEHVYKVTAVKAATYFAKGSETSVCRICGATTTKAIAKKKVALASAKSSKKGVLAVKSKALEDSVTGYKIQYSTSKKFTKKTTKTVTVKTNSAKALSKTIKGLTSGKKYYVRIAVYSGKKTSAYTKAKAVKIK